MEVLSIRSRPCLDELEVPKRLRFEKFLEVRHRNLQLSKFMLGCAPGNVDVLATAALRVDHPLIRRDLRVQRELSSLLGEPGIAVLRDVL